MISANFGGSIRTLFLSLLVIAPVGATASMPAEYADALAKFERGEYAEAYPGLFKFAQDGHQAAMRVLGHMYREGLGVEKSSNESRAWYNRAQRLKKTEHADGELEWTKRLASRGHAWAQMALGWSLGPSDPAQAIHWLTKAAEGDYALAHCELGSIYSSGRYGVRKDDALVLSWWRAGAERGEAMCMYNLGQAHENGRYGLEKDPHEAVKLYKEAASLDDAEAMDKLGYFYARGEGGLEKDMSEAVKWYHRSAELGYAWAQNRLAMMYVQGSGVPRDYSKALHWAAQAVAQEFSAAMVNLGVLYQDGLGVPKNLEMAEYWYRKADEKGHPQAKKNLAVLEREKSMRSVDNAIDSLSKMIGIVQNVQALQSLQDANRRPDVAGAGSRPGGSYCQELLNLANQCRASDSRMGSMPGAPRPGGKSGGGGQAGSFNACYENYLNAYKAACQ